MTSITTCVLLLYQHTARNICNDINLTIHLQYMAKGLYSNSSIVRTSSFDYLRIFWIFITRLCLRNIKYKFINPSTLYFYLKYSTNTTHIMTPKTSPQMWRNYVYSCSKFHPYFDLHLWWVLKKSKYSLCYRYSESAIYRSKQPYFHLLW